MSPAKDENKGENKKKTTDAGCFKRLEKHLKVTGISDLWKVFYFSSFRHTADP